MREARAEAVEAATTAWSICRPYLHVCKRSSPWFSCKRIILHTNIHIPSILVLLGSFTFTALAHVWRDRELHSHAIADHHKVGQKYLNFFGRRKIAHLDAKKRSVIWVARSSKKPADDLTMLWWPEIVCTQTEYQSRHRDVKKAYALICF